MTNLSVESELNRKALETLSELLEGYDEGRYHASAVLGRLTSIWDVCAGLVDRDIMDAIVEAQSQIEDEANKPVFELFEGRDGVYALQIIVTPKSSLLVYDGKNFRDMKRDEATFETVARRAKLKDAIMQKGTPV